MMPFHFFLGQVTLPDTGVDVTEYITAMVTAIGLVLAAAMAAGVAFYVVKRGYALAKRLIKG